MTLHLAHPDHRHTVRRHEKCPIENLPQSVVILRFAYAMDAGDGHVAALALPDSVEEKLTGAILVEHTNPDTEDVYLLNFHGSTYHNLLETGERWGRCRHSEGPCFSF